jgi:hypothetical protein
MTHQEPHGPEDSFPQGPASLLAAVGEEEEIALNNAAKSLNRKGSGRGVNTNNGDRGQNMTNLATNILLIALCLLFLCFCYRKINRHAPPSHNDARPSPQEAANTRL